MEIFFQHFEALSDVVCVCGHGTLFLRMDNLVESVTNE